MFFIDVMDYFFKCLRKGPPIPYRRSSQQLLLNFNFSFQATSWGANGLFFSIKRHTLIRSHLLYQKFLLDQRFFRCFRNFFIFWNFNWQSLLFNVERLQVVFHLQAVLAVIQTLDVWGALFEPLQHYLCHLSRGGNRLQEPRHRSTMLRLRFKGAHLVLSELPGFERWYCQIKWRHLLLYIVARF